MSYNVLIRNAIVLSWFISILPVCSFNKRSVCINNLFSRSIIYIQVNSSRFYSNFFFTDIFKINKIFYSSTTESVKSLVIITYYTNILVTTCELHINLFLNCVCILVFIHNHMLKYSSRQKLLRNILISSLL